jgi:hypothetical protein
VNEELESAELDIDSLREMLEEAELRKDARIKKLGGRVGLAITIPILLLFLWAGIFLIRYNIENPPGERAPEKPPANTPVSATTPLTDEQKDMAQYDLFRDEKDRVVKTNALGLETTSDKLIDKEDIHFAMELLNFMHRPADPPPAEH